MQGPAENVRQLRQGRAVPAGDRRRPRRGPALQHRGPGTGIQQPQEICL